MYRTIVKVRYLVLLILFFFCFSSTAIGGLLLFDPEIHFGNGSALVHYGNEDHGLGEADHSDANIVLHLDCLTTNSPGSIKTCPVINLFLRTNFYPEYQRNFSEISSIHYSSINRLYDLHDTFKFLSDEEEHKLNLSLI